MKKSFVLLVFSILFLTGAAMASDASESADVLVEYAKHDGNIVLLCNVKNTTPQILREIILEIKYFDKKNEQINAIQFNALENKRPLLGNENCKVYFRNVQNADRKVRDIEVKVVKTVVFKSEFSQLPSDKYKKIKPSVLNVTQGTDGAIAIQGVLVNGTHENLGYVKAKFTYQNNAGQSIRTFDHTIVDANSSNKYVKKYFQPSTQQSFLVVEEKPANKSWSDTVQIEITDVGVIKTDDIAVIDLVKTRKKKKFQESLRNNGGFKIGIGFGPTNGVLGASTELLIGDYASFGGGIGSVELLIPGAGLFWSIGGKVYFVDREYKFRPRVGVAFGPAYKFIVNNITTNVQTTETVYGAYPSVGFEWHFIEHMSLDLDVGYWLREGLYGT